MELGQLMKDYAAEADINNCQRYILNADADMVSLALLYDERRDQQEVVGMRDAYMMSLALSCEPLSDFTVFDMPVTSNPIPTDGGTDVFVHEAAFPASGDAGDEL
jgi:hypothetical protein